MLPLIPFVAGILTGVAALRLLKSDTTRAGLNKAQVRLCASAATGLNALETGYTKVRQGFAQAAESGQEETAKTPSTEKPRRRKKAASTDNAPPPTPTPKPRRRAAVKSRTSPGSIKAEPEA